MASQLISMEALLQHQGGSETLRTLLNHMIAGTPINQPSPGGNISPMRTYFISLAQHNTIFSIMKNDPRFNKADVTLPGRKQGTITLGTTSTDISLQLHVAYLTRVDGADAGVDGADDADKENNKGDSIRPATDNGCRQQIYCDIAKAFENMGKLAEFVATAWQDPIDKKTHPLWRPAAIKPLVNPFAIPYPDNDDNNIPIRRRSTVLYCRQVVNLWYLHQAMEGAVSAIFAAGQSEDKGASFSKNGIDIFAANEGIITDFIFVRGLYLQYCRQTIWRAEVANVGTVKEYQLSQKRKSIEELLSSTSI